MWHSHEPSHRKMMVEMKQSTATFELCCCSLDFVGDFVSVHVTNLVYSDIILTYSPCV